ncbi:MAG: AraC family transcriptional regulator [Saccharospirillum sp.]
MFFGTTLGPYTRLLQASPEEWLGSLKALLNLPELTFISQPAVQTFPAIAQLETPSASLTSLCVPASTAVFAVNSDRPALVWVRSGLIQDQKDVFIVPAGTPIGVANEGHAALTVIHFASDNRLPEQELTSHQRQQVRWLLEHYQLRAQYFADHHSTVQETETMLCQLNDCLAKPRLALNLPGRHLVDPRIDRIIQFISDHPQWEFNLGELVAMCHSSERTLYNRMKRATGMTPYRYYQRCKLMRLRAALLQCETDSPSISWHALEHGFNHLGRLPSLYMKLFGEKPSETLARRKRLRERAFNAGQPADPAPVRRSG